MAPESQDPETDRAEGASAAGASPADEPQSAADDRSSAGAKAERQQRRSQDYWRANIRWVAILLSIWFLVSFGCGILFVEPLNEIRVGGFRLGFWFAQQGSIYVFVVLIAVYVRVMNALDRKYGIDDE